MGNLRIDEDQESLRVKRDQSATSKLLELLIKHHDFTVPKAPPGWKPPKLRREPEPVAKVNEIRILDVKRAACMYFRVPLMDMLSKRRTRELTYPRHIAYYLSKKHTLRSFPEIGKHFGDRDHTTILHGFKKIEAQLEDEHVARDIEAVEALL